MNKTSFLLPLAALAAAVLLGGCDTFNKRADEKSAVFDALSPATQKRLERGKIHVGDSEDLVYIALGNPDEKRQVTRADGTEAVWVYRTYWEQYEGRAWVGWRRIVVPAAGGRGYVVYHEPVTQDIYRTRVDEVIRVTFTKGVVSVVEQNKR
ncbi:MAG: hypothetical protein NTV51_22185 [Verrucomicrobia bacterium]|nr:hypothetical protein [Verrucomicrobiota bacterium]